MEIILAMADEETQEKIDAVSVWILYSGLTAVNMYYLLYKIIRLQHTRFHIMMFLILQLGYICYIVEHGYRWFSYEENIT